jgi:hypothetical protein
MRKIFVGIVAVFFLFGCANKAESRKEFVQKEEKKNTELAGNIKNILLTEHPTTKIEGSPIEETLNMGFQLGESYEDVKRRVPSLSEIEYEGANVSTYFSHEEKQILIITTYIFDKAEIAMVDITLFFDTDNRCFNMVYEHCLEKLVATYGKPSDNTVGGGIGLPFELTTWSNNKTFNKPEISISRSLDYVKDKSINVKWCSPAFLKKITDSL